ncbi:hypothetical protein B0T10DRAFT_457772 [Thelonectria olida]|uniref:Uncharacterized protein n=1 Tax=Thelonectria olida TaxID=1576542 RepID=A0A9P9ANF9_9HYPO|nr:hypothetical protein B0T10DRAFT_457772 [Thelonectria olida]
MATAMTALTRLRATTAVRTMTTTLSRRTYSTKKQPGPTSLFYRQFTRPFAKTMLIAVFTYQSAYWLWTKAETDEIRAERDVTIAGLEATVKEYEAKTKSAVEGKSS